MRSVVGMAVAVLAAMVAATAAITPQFNACPLTVALSTKPKATSSKAGVTAGGKVAVTFKVSKTDKKGWPAALGQGNVTITVPPELCVLATGPKGAHIDTASGNVVWSGVNFNKLGARTFRVRTRVQSYYNQSSCAGFSAQADIPALQCSSVPVSVEVS